MLASLLPFFLVARIAVDEFSWQNGPEYVFDVDMNITTTPMNYDGIKQNNYTTMNLICRPRGADRLRCYLDNIKLQSIDITNDNEVDISDEEVKGFPNKATFDIKFNDDGVEYLIVPYAMHVFTLNHLKQIVELLHIGADLNGIPDGTFHEAENSTIGRCNVTFGINHFPSKDILRKTKNLRYELESLPQLNKVSGEAIVIRKMRNLNNCSDYASFYYGTYGNNNVVEEELNSHLESSKSQIFVSDTHFESWSMRIGSFGTPEESNHTHMREIISLILKDIRQARDELPEIPDEAKTNIVANSDIDRFYSMK